MPLPIDIPHDAIDAFCQRCRIRELSIFCLALIRKRDDRISMRQMPEYAHQACEMATGYEQPDLDTNLEVTDKTARLALWV